MADTIQKSKVTTWFTEKMEQCMMNSPNASVFFTQDRFHRMADELVSTLEYSHDPSVKINDCVELAVQIMGIAWRIDKDKEKS